MIITVSKLEIKDTFSNFSCYHVFSDKRHLSILIAIIALKGDKMKGLLLRSEKKKTNEHFYSVVLGILANVIKQGKINV